MPPLVATIDLGSNSFHLIIARVLGANQWTIVERYKRKVQLRSGLTADGELDAESTERALDCLRYFAEHLRQHQVNHIDVVGTYTLRKLNSEHYFFSQAKSILGQPIRVIPGEEEARLVFVGASTSQDITQRALLIDIGGGSTELIIGENHHIRYLQSLELGCVSTQDQCFVDKKLNRDNFEHAIQLAKTTIAPYVDALKVVGWQQVMGASGTFQAIFSLLGRGRKKRTEITLKDLYWVMKQLTRRRWVWRIHFAGLRKDRENILPGGLAVLIALVESLDIQSIKLSRGAIREGILYELTQTVIQGND